MKRLIFAAAMSLAATAVHAQVPFQVVATGVTNPAGMFEDNGEVFVTGPGGVIHLAPADRTNPNPLDTGTYVPDDGLQCPTIPLASGQMYQVNDILAYLTITDPGKGSNNKPVGGAYALSFDPQQVFPACPEGNLTQLAPDKGLNGPVATSIAPGPEGKQYVGSQRNGNIVRVNGANVESVGGIPGGQPIWSMEFVGSDLYLAAGNGFYVLRNAPACSGNQNNCGVPTLITGGPAVAVKGDGNGHVLFAQTLGGTVTRFNLGDGSFTPITSGRTFALASALLGFDHHRNLWVGGSDISRALAADLAAQ